MKILVVSPRYPEPGGKGDQLRAFQQIRYLARGHDVTVLTTSAPSTAAAAAALEQIAHVVARTPPRAARAASVILGLLRGCPGQVGWMTTAADWRAVRELAGSADVVLLSTVRAARGPLPAPAVLDHIDCLSLNMAIRARGPEGRLVRLAASVEGPLLTGWERRCARWASAQVVTAAEDARSLPPEPPIEIIPQGWDGDPFQEAAGHRRDIDVIFTGNMAYPPNRDAAQWLAGEIAPRLRAKRPDVRLVVAGRAAARLDLPGVEIASDVPDLHDYLRRSRVAVVPLREGTGAPNKVVEAAASGAALVATPWTLDRFSMRAVTASTPAEFAVEIDRLLGDESARRAAVEQAAPAGRAHTVAALVGRLEALLVRVGEAGPQA